MDNIKIRFAQISDYESIERIMQQVQQLHFTWRPDIYKTCDTVLPYDNFLETVNMNTTIVAEVDGCIVGLLAYMRRHVESERQVTRDILFIDVMAVDERYRGNGTGQCLFDYIKEVAKKEHYDGIELQVNARNRRAYDMYKRYGFTEKSINMELL